MSDPMLEKFEQRRDAFERQMEANTNALLQAIEEWRQSNCSIMREISVLSDRVAALEAKSDNPGSVLIERAPPLLIH